MLQNATVLAITGWSGEARLAARIDVPAFCSGGRAQALDDLTRWHSKPAAAVISFGIAGGLHSFLPSGAIIIGTGALTATGFHPTNAELSDCWADKLSASGCAIFRGKVFSSDVIVRTAEAKRALARATNALAIDMESRAAAQLSAHLGARFAVLRAVADPVWRSMPPAVTGGLREDGTADSLRVLRLLSREPRQLPDLVLTCFDTLRALRALSRVGRLLGRRFGVPAL